MRIIVGRRALLYSTDRMSLVPYEGDHDWWVKFVEDEFKNVTEEVVLDPISFHNLQSFLCKILYDQGMLSYSTQSSNLLGDD